MGGFEPCPTDYILGLCKARFETYRNMQGLHTGWIRTFCATDHLLDFAGRLLTDNQKLFSFAYRGVFLCRTSEHGDACVSGSRIVAGALGFTEMTLYSRTMRTMYHVVQHCSDIALRVEYMSYTRDTKELSIPF